MKISWKPYIDINVLGKPYWVEIPGDNRLLLEISQMPKKKPISLHKAHHMAWRKICSMIGTGKGREASIILNDWVKWISLYGYSIQLIGNEFESVEEPTA